MGWSSFGAQSGWGAFRRPLTTDELARFNKVVSDGPTITATGSVNEIAQTVLYMFLVSPSFLTRGEMTQAADASGNYPLSGTEVAQRLSFMLWGSIPDDALNTAADNNQLSTPAQIQDNPAVIEAYLGQSAGIESAEA